MKNNGNKVVLGVASALLIIGFGVGYWYSQKYSDIPVTFKEANVIINTYENAETCFRVGIVPKTSKSDLGDIVYRLSVTDYGKLGGSSPEGKLNKEAFEETLSKRVAYLNYAVNRTDYTVLQAEVDKKVCQQIVDRAINIKKQYN